MEERIIQIMKTSAMNKYNKEIEEIAKNCTISQSDGYSQIMRICEAMKEEQQICVCGITGGTNMSIEIMPIIKGLELELNHHLYEAEYPEEYNTEITAEIACIRLFDEKRADKWEKAYSEQKEGTI